MSMQTNLLKIIRSGNTYNNFPKNNASKHFSFITFMFWGTGYHSLAFANGLTVRLTQTERSQFSVTRQPTKNHYLCSSLMPHLVNNSSFISGNNS